MKDYEEFKDLRREVDPNNPFSALYFYESGESFYLEPAFYTQLMGFKDHFPDKYHLIINRMEELVKKAIRVLQENKKKEWKRKLAIFSRATRAYGRCSSSCVSSALSRSFRLRAR